MSNMDHIQTGRGSKPIRAGKASKSNIRSDAQNSPRTPFTMFYSMAGKRLLDLALILTALPFIVLVVSVLAVCVMMDGGKPFFGHRRIGRNGKSFRCWKLRTMVPNAEEQLKDYLAKNPAAKEEWATSFKLTHDPRITRLGNFLRKTSLDELPQIWNIIKGEMSIVGPRPVTKDELAMYGRDLPYYEAMRPGLTGLWQVSGRNDVAYSDRVQLDVKYAKTLGMMMDIQIIRGTFNAVLDRTGC